MIGWPIHLNRTLVTRSTLRTSLNDALYFLQDAPNVIKLNPLVVDYHREESSLNDSDSDTSSLDDVSELETYTIVDSLPLFGGLWKTKISYRARIEKSNKDGIIFWITATGMTSENHWRVKSSEKSGLVEVEEQSNVNAFFLFVPFIVGSIRSSHQVLMERLREQLEHSSPSKEC